NGCISLYNAVRLKPDTTYDHVRRVRLQTDRSGLPETIDTAVLRRDDDPAGRDRRRGRDPRAVVELPLFDAGLRVEPVQPPVARSDIDAAGGNRRRRVHACPRREAPGGLAGGRLDRMDDLVAAPDDDASLDQRSRRVERELAVRIAVPPRDLLRAQIDPEHF